MNSILNAIRDKMGSMNNKERAAAAFIAENASRVIRMGITELAAKSMTSSATISRLCKLFHFQGYTDFKMKLAAELALTSTEQYQDIVAGNDLENIVAAMETNHTRSIADTTRLLDREQLRKAISALQNARQIDIYGVATSGIVAQDFHQKLVRVGKRAVMFTDAHMQITSAANLMPGDAAFAISYSGETPETIDALACAKERGATTVSITKYGPSKLAELSDIKLFTSTLEEGMRRGDMASRIAQLHVIDILFTGLLSQEFHDLVPRLELSYQMVQKYRSKKTGTRSGKTGKRTGEAGGTKE